MDTPAKPGPTTTLLPMHDTPRRTRIARRLTIEGLLVLVCLLAQAGCGGASQQAIDDPLGVLGDPDATTRSKSVAVRAVARMSREGEIDAEVGRELLKRTAWGRGNRPDVRNAAIDELHADDPSDTARMLSLMLPTENHWPVIEHVCNLAVETNSTEMIPALVRSWARPVQRPADDERPERAALLTLAPDQPIEQTVFAVFASNHDPDDQFAERTRRDAWTLLSRIDPAGATTKEYIAQATDVQDDPILMDLQIVARDLSAIPLTTEQLEWVEDLREPERAAFWNDAKRQVASLNDAQREGFELRHVAGVLWAAQHRSEWLASTRRQLLDLAEAELDGRRHTRRSADFPDAMTAPKEDIDHWRKDLVWGDALLILIASEAVNQPDVIRELYEQADHDMRDESTEHGGILDAAEGDAFKAYSYPPRPAQRSSDNRFVASPELLDAGATALFHYHFHAQTFSNSDYAGPGPGDLDYAKRFGRSCLVLTFTSKNALGVDYYQPDGARIDLGSIARPSRR